MQNFIPKLLLPLTTLLVINFSLEAQERINKNISGFNAIQVSSGIDLYLSQSGKESVEIEADEDILDEVIVEMRNNTLTIKIERDFLDWFRSSGPIKAFVSFKDLQEIHISGGSDLEGQGALKFDKLQMTSSGGSDIKISLRANELDISSSGGSDVVLAGYAAYFEGSASGGSDIEAKDMDTDVANLSSSGGSDIQISVNRKLIANASGGSDIIYHGNPEEVEKNESGGGDIIKR